jgi:hypothetical protein
MAGCVCGGRSTRRQLRFYGGLGEISKMSNYTARKEHTGHAEKRVRFGGQADSNHCRIGLVVYFSLPVVDLILFRNGQVRLNATFRIEELDFRTPFHKAVCDL